MSADKLQLFHEEIMQEEGIELSDLPESIQKKIKGFNLLKAGYDKNPQERTLINLRKRAVNLGDEIQTFIENDYDDEDENEDETKTSNGGEKPSKEKADKPASKNDEEKKGNNPMKQKPVSTDGKFGNLMMEKKILAIMEAKGEKRIKIADLQAIIGREPEYPEQRVNNIKLRKVFLSSDYRLV
jgi:hypothetical protein